MRWKNVNQLDHETRIGAAGLMMIELTDGDMESKGRRENRQVIRLMAAYGRSLLKNLVISILPVRLAALAMSHLATHFSRISHRTPF